MAALAAALYLGVGAFLSALFSCVGLVMAVAFFVWFAGTTANWKR